MRFSILATLIYIALKRLWLSLLFCFSVFLLAFVYGKINEPPFASVDYIFIKKQFERSINLRNVNMILAGDSSGVSGIDPISLEKQFKTMKVQVLSSAIFVGPLGHIILAENYLKNNHHLDILVIIWSPLALSSSQSFPWESFILNGTGGQLRTISRLGRAVLREKLFLGLLNPPFPGIAGQVYVNGENFRNKIDEQHGTLVYPTRKTAINIPSPQIPYDYSLSSAVESNLRKASFKLKELSINKIFLIITPIPNGLYDPKSETRRKQLISKIQKLLRLPRKSLLEIPPSLPNELYSDPHHFNGNGRTIFTQIFKKSLSNALCKSNIKTSKECANTL